MHLSSHAFRCLQLPSRSLLRLRGSGVTDFLQGLFTNDLRLLHPGEAMWGCFLFFTGRLFCDAMLMHARQPRTEGTSSDVANTVYVDVHAERAEELLDYLVEMRLRRKIAVEDVSTQWKLGVTWSPLLQLPTEVPTLDCTSVASSEAFLDPRDFAIQRQVQAWSTQSDDSLCSPHNNHHTDTRDNVQADRSSSSPPLQLQRVLMPCEAPTCMSACVDPSTDHDAAAQYTQLLHACGIGEGPRVFQYKKTLPFEANVDFLRGVSFNKGCYVGQELTHRTHVMLVTRRRTVPLRFASDAVPVGAALYCDDGAHKVGEVTEVCGRYGLGLVRLRYVDAESHTIAGLRLESGAPVTMSLPAWWPPKQVKKLLKKDVAAEKEQAA